MPSDTILFPRRMLYVQAVLGLLLVVTSFGLGYLIGRGPAKPPGKDKDDAAVANRVPVEGRVVTPLLGQKQALPGAVVIILPADKMPGKPLAVIGLRPADAEQGSSDPVKRALIDFGGASARSDADGRFTVFVPQAGSYRALIISSQGTRSTNDPFENRDLAELGKYFDSPSELLLHSRYKWLTWDIKAGMSAREVVFAE